MATIVPSLPLPFIFFYFLPHIAAATCGVSTCPASGLSIRFPFRLNDRQEVDCGYSSSFDVSCNKLGQTILNLPSSGDFIVETISYTNQLVWINDLDNCIFKRFLDHKNLSLLGSPFQYSFELQEYTFYKCLISYLTPGLRISCLSSVNYEVVAVMSSVGSPPPFCYEITRALVPAESNEYDSNLGLRLTWNVPDCRVCEARGDVCGFQTGSHSEIIKCSQSRTTPSHYGLSSKAKIGGAIGILIPGLLFLTWFTLYISSPRTDRSRLQESGVELSGMVTNSRLPHQLYNSGLDVLTIESYPKTQLGENLELLPDPNDKTCSICLAEYLPKETVRTIPECNHYFHANCIDEWLRKNSTCPLCRNHPVFVEINLQHNQPAI